MKPTRIRTAGVTAVAALALPMTLGVLAPQASADTPSPSSSMSSSSSASPSDNKPFGPGCSSLPSSGNGSTAEMVKARVVTAAEQNPDLSMLVSAIKQAGLTDSLNNAKDSTVFAPTNAAFHKLGKAKVAALLKDKVELKKVLSYHVVEKKEIKPSELANGSFTTLEGSKLTTSGSGDSYKVNGTAPITCGNISTANAKVYLVDGILMPPSS
ncbi:fasciclin domain-containing protein [Streptomyces griseoviridis]|uniref:Beta-Ig-H3/fasciclin n=2 Tax=Streptomyces TaxID=1883 RepID=A0A3Q9L0J6_STRGD|nr:MULTISPECIES: fasciclin domain-containing protein [Streptomyces]AZS88773.1 fasciclin domain-containing protein [Streptomyces griseoviridis]MDT0471481.1 fasciclin domain-containing protein [Streptomyces sp. DSM 41014]QCN84387.1 beta-Ig-H3/fasciclin [Streptomyces griseoviridis]